MVIDPNSRRHIPKILYKYGGPVRIDVLRNCKLKISSPFEFNDPFEFYPHFIPPTYEYLRQKAAAKNYADPDGCAKHCLEHWDEDEEKLQSQHRENLRGYGCVCLSAVYDDILLWGHYTDCHTGLVIGFAFAEHSNIKIEPVQYSEERPQWDCVKYVYTPPPVEAVKDIVYTKSTHWDYEKEYRIFFHNSKAPLPEFLSFPPHLIECVYIGCNDKGQLQQEVLHTVSLPGFEHVKVYKATMDKKHYALSFTRVK